MLLVEHQHRLLANVVHARKAQSVAQLQPGAKVVLGLCVQGVLKHGGAICQVARAAQIELVSHRVGAKA